MKKLIALLCAVVLTTTMPVTALANDDLQSRAFSDVDQDQWYAPAVKYMEEHGIMKGYDGTDVFGVNDTMTRGQFAVVLWRYNQPEEAAAYDEATAINETGLPDVEDGKYYTGAANWAVKNRVITGADTPNGTFFEPDADMTFEQMVAILDRVFSTQDEHDNTLFWVIWHFNDSNTISEWAQSSMAWAIQMGYVTGSNDCLYPQSYVTRARAATVLYRVLTKSTATNDITYDDCPAYSVNIPYQLYVTDNLHRESYNSTYSGSDGLYYGYEMNFSERIIGHVFSVVAISQNWGPQGEYESYLVGPSTTVPGANIWVTTAIGGHPEYYAQYVTVK